MLLILALSTPPVCFSANCAVNKRVSGVTRSMVTPGPETEVTGESGSGGLGAVSPDAEKGLILHVLRIS